MNEFIWTDELVLLALDFAHHNGYHKFPQKCVEVFDEVKNQAIHGGYKYPKWITDHIQSKQQSLNNQDWEILEIESHGGERRKLIDGLYRIYDDGIGFDLNYLLKRNDTKIISVKVLSSGEIFSLGDRVRYKPVSRYGSFVIKKMWINSIEPNRMMVSNEEQTIVEEINGNLEKVKQPLFTTEQQSEIKSIIEEYLKCK